MFRAIPPGVITFQNLEPGHAVLRLWHSQNLSPSIHISASHADKGYDRLGSRVETIVEAVTFSGSTEAVLSKGFSIAGGVRVLAATPFVDANGGGVAGPFYSNGKYTTKEPAFGTLVVEYIASYTAYRVYYGLPDWVIQRIFVDGARIEDFSLPPVLVMAFDKGHAATAQIERRIAQSRPAPCENNEWLTDVGASVVVKYNVYTEKNLDPDTGEPKPGADYLTTAAYLVHEEYCKAEPARRRRQEFSKPSAKNIKIISIEKGKI
ncbi:MAG: hypothetical protein OEZ04_11230 [Nitrospinota bacterium]|nr:hypothetical protein [Nitrospinota bacterium]